VRQRQADAGSVTSGRRNLIRYSPNVYPKPPEDFARDGKFLFPEPVYRREMKKLRHALTAFDRLPETTQEWAKSANLRFIERQSTAHPGALEIMGRIDSLPPVEDWWFQASDAFGNLRDALDQLNHNIFRYVAGTDPGLIRFPMATKGSQWRDWRKKANAAGYPTWLIARYKRFQPYSTHRATLTTLETIANKEKHREGVTAALSLSHAEFSNRQFSVTPMLPNDFDGSLVQADFPPTIDLDATEFLVVTTSIPGYTIQIEENERPANFDFQFVLRVGGEEIPLKAAVQRITGEVLWATSHVIGREPNGTVHPSTFDLSLEADINASSQPPRT